MSILSAARYRDVCALIGASLDHEEPCVRPAGSPFGWSTGVYAVGHRHRSARHLDIDYVGSAVRLGGDVASRVREHLRDPEKASAFHCQVLFPLREDTPISEVRRLEGVVPRSFGIPVWCRRVPGGRD